VASGTCIHGYTPDSCLICQTLQQAPAKTRERRSGRRDAGALATGPRAAAVARPDAIFTGPVEHRSRVPLSLRLGAGLLVLALVGIMLFWVIGIVYAALRLVELVATALVAGWAGWKLGVHHGRRQARRQQRG
jgi:hypothetical protein